MKYGKTTTFLGKKVRLIDLSQPLEDTRSEPNPPRIKRISHEECALMWKQMFGIPKDALPTGSGFAGEIVESSTHAGTHIDAPWHYTKNTGVEKKADTIDKLPLGWFIGEAVVIDVSDLPTGGLVTTDHIENKLGDIEHEIKPGEIVLFHTGADRYWGTEKYFSFGCGLGEDAVLHLVDQGVNVIGTDAWSLDRPYPVIGNEWKEHRDPSRLWPAHYAGRKRSYSQIEKLTNLDKLPPVGSSVICFPVKVNRGSAGWSRVAGIIPVE